MSLQERYPHEHKWYPLQQGAYKQIFEQIKGSNLYESKNYLLMFCSCGESLMSRLKEDVEHEDN